MHIAMTSADANSIKNKYSTQRPNPNKMILYNVQKDVYDQHVRLLSNQRGGPQNRSVAEVLESLDLETLDDALKKRIAARLGL